MSELISHATAFIPHMVFSIILFIFFWVIGIVAKSFISRLGNHTKDTKKFVFLVIGQFTKAAIILIGLVTALGSLGVNVSALVTSLGLTGVAFSLAMKDILSNLLSGLIILIYQPFSVADYIKVKDTAGKVVGVDLRYTYLNDNGQRVLVPNATVLTNVVVVNP